MQFTGIVERGKGEGRRLGYPTANIPLPDSTVAGIYAARATLPNEAPYRAAAFADPARGILEAHLLDFDDDLYGLAITVELLEKLRENVVFESEETLKEAISKDVAAVREYFNL